MRHRVDHTGRGTGRTGHCDSATSDASRLTLAFGVQRSTFVKVAAGDSIRDPDPRNDGRRVRDAPIQAVGAARPAPVVGQSERITP